MKMAKQKIRQPQHCAHVAEYYADRARLFVSFIHDQVFGFRFADCFVPPDHEWGLSLVKRAPAFISKAIKEFNSAGGWNADA